MSEDFEKLRQIVLRDVELQRELREISAQDEFVSRVVAMGAAQGLAFVEDDVLEAMRQNRRSWLERWI